MDFFPPNLQVLLRSLQLLLRVFMLQMALMALMALMLLVMACGFSWYLSDGLVSN